MERRTSSKANMIKPDTATVCGGPTNQAGRTPILTSLGSSSKAQVATKTGNVQKIKGSSSRRVAVLSYEAPSLPDYGAGSGI